MGFYFGVLPLNDASGIANSEDPVIWVSTVCLNVSVRKFRIFTVHVHLYAVLLKINDLDI